MDPKDFRKHGHELIDWVADYLEGGAEKHPVLPRIQPGELRGKLPTQAPEPEQAPAHEVNVEEASAVGVSVTAVPVVNDPALTVAVISVSPHAVGVQTARFVQLV